MADWEQRAAKKRQDLRDSIPAEWIIPENLMPPEDQLDVTTFPEKSGWFTPEELSITSHQKSEDISAAERYQKFENPFEHSPLDHDQIRLLSLLPGGNDVCCTIEKADLKSAAARYEALSYCWGNNEQSRHTIWINGHPFEVSSNLYEALMQLRQRTSTRKLWIDAICINQVGDKDQSEKNSQIPLMGKMYHLAARVIVWLGVAEDRSFPRSLLQGLSQHC